MKRKLLKFGETSTPISYGETSPSGFEITGYTKLLCYPGVDAGYHHLDAGSNHTSACEISKAGSRLRSVTQKRNQSRFAVKLGYTKK